jgi:putative oxidoreductase
MNMRKCKAKFQSQGILVGRILIALLFFVSGVNMLIGGVGNSAMYFESMGLPLSMLLAILVIALKIIAGGALILGYKAEEAAVFLFVFTGLTILIAHLDTADMGLWKNLSIMGGLLYVMAYGVGDAWVLKKNTSDSSEKTTTDTM